MTDMMKNGGPANMIDQMGEKLDADHVMRVHSEIKPDPFKPGEGHFIETTSEDIEEIQSQPINLGLSPPKGGVLPQVSGFSTFDEEEKEPADLNHVIEMAKRSKEKAMW